MKRFRAAALLVLVLAAAAAIALPRLRPVSFHGTDLGTASAPQDFTLRSGRGPVSLSDFEGRVVLLFFGYTSCPDVCPATMGKLGRVAELLGERRRDVQVLLVTVDPEVDSTERLGAYVRRFDPAFLGLTGEPDEIRAVAGSLGAWAGRPQPAHGARVIGHTSHVFGFDGTARLRLLWGPDLTAAQIAADVRALLGR